MFLVGVDLVPVGFGLGFYHIALIAFSRGKMVQIHGF